MVLDHGGGHHVVGSEPQAVRQVVDRLGGVAHQDDHVVAARAPPGEAVHGGAGRLVLRGGAARLVARPSVHARVPGQELVDAVGHRLQRRGRGGAVEIAVGPVDAVETGHRSVGTDERREFGLRCHAVTLRSAGTPGRGSAPGSRTNGTPPPGPGRAPGGPVPALPCPRGGALRVRAGPLGSRARRRRPRAGAPERGHLRAAARRAARRSSMPTSSGIPPAASASSTWCSGRSPPAHRATGRRPGGQPATFSPLAESEPGRHVGPVDDVPQGGEEVGLHVLVLQVEGVLPGVEDEQRDRPVARRCPGGRRPAPRSAGRPAARRPAHPSPSPEWSRWPG